MDRNLVMVKPNATQDNGNRGHGQPGETAAPNERVIEERRRYSERSPVDLAKVRMARGHDRTSEVLQKVFSSAQASRSARR